MTTIEFEGSDMRDVLDLILEHRGSMYQPVRINGKVYDSWKEVAALLPNEPLQPKHQEKVAPLFRKNQQTYRSAAFNIVNMRHAAAVNDRRKKAVRAFNEKHKTEIRAEREESEHTELFKNRGLSDRTIKALVDCGISSPERLHFMEKKQIAKVHGIGRAGLAEIMRYKERYSK